MNIPRPVIGFSSLWVVVGGLCAYAAFSQGRYILFEAKGNPGGGGFLLGLMELYGLCPLAILHALFGLVLLVPRPMIRTLGLAFSVTGFIGSILIAVFGGVFLAILGLAALVMLGEGGRWLEIVGVLSLPVLYPVSFYILKYTSIRLYYGP